MSYKIPTRELFVMVSVNSEISEGFIHVGLEECLIDYINQATKEGKSHIALTNLQGRIELLPIAITSILIKESL